ncbi:hypothetical protein [Natrarchaeobaculum sulfurireducens]|uniref:hypothetical protein n=1 Tax=Natrarchaeobaculum sulfurireducens TaxID=2044521 RepID=UPI00164269B0|nr:hypothetical protein [Natrarchaeobaculum sulfurireducens]
MNPDDEDAVADEVAILALERWVRRAATARDGGVEGRSPTVIDAYSGVRTRY